MPAVAVNPINQARPDLFVDNLFNRAAYSSQAPEGRQIEDTIRSMLARLVEQQKVLVDFYVQPNYESVKPQVTFKVKVRFKDGGRGKLLPFPSDDSTTTV